ncbi:DUF2971 domain-containing protein [Sphingomonas hengshuiensis]|uniref:DUF2971 domain-containing protein n=1 Tax=Sphingomonas hengshuiensis TaxID=1609977 RepID=UPI0009820957|nr:DUF2971 domain-containing protein [Sphingomonas hengshuiensis]
MKGYSETVRELPPASLYKYRTPFRPQLERDRDIIVGSRLWAASPLAFNDPFDCFPFVDLSGSEREKRQWVKRYGMRHFAPAPRHKRRRMVQQIEQGLRVSFRQGVPNADAGAQDAWRDVLARTGVVSLAERADDMLMWGYYADSHQGYCLEFTTNKEPFMLANRVKYADERPVFRLFDPDRSDLMERLLLQKASFWRHEREWRIARMQGIGAIEFPPECLTAIILGANISRDDEAALRQMASDGQHAIAIRRARLDAKSFKLTIVDA